MRLLLDTDAFHVLRHLGVLEAVLKLPGIEWIMTDTAARRELHDIPDVVAALVSADLLRVEKVEARTPAHAHFRKLRKSGVDVGEAEAIAWGSSVGGDVIFVSQDVRARAVAEAEGIPAIDVTDLLSLAVRDASIDPAAVATALAPWDDRRDAFGRPRDWKGFDSTMRSRQASLAERGVALPVAGAR